MGAEGAARRRFAGNRGVLQIGAGRFERLAGCGKTLVNRSVTVAARKAPLTVHKLPSRAREQAVSKSVFPRLVRRLKARPTSAPASDERKLRYRRQGGR